MATIGLDKLFYAEITEDSDGSETYGVPASLAKAISADLSVELAEATLYADDGASEIVKEFKSGTLSLGIDDIGNDAASVLTGATIDSNNVVISTSRTAASPWLSGFGRRSLTASTVISGFIGSSSVFRQPRLQQRATALRFPHLQSRERFSAEISRTAVESTLGKRKRPRARRTFRTA